ncbi:MAG: asparagine synthase-related protein [Coleofasciculus sp. A1-SPW-01]|uniref:asparagine synthase-related protein n=1 Tax=Coleofasciculus sp. A1-SPW-01 TaxID=3070819 RepID=UPI0033055922
MANFIILIDPDSERRSHYIKTIEPLLPPVANLVTHSCSGGNFHAIWAAHPQAPISTVTTAEGAAIIWGEAITPDSSTRIDAARLQRLWHNAPATSYFDGYYAAVVYEPDGRLMVGADVLGIFPVYYYTHQDVALVASSPELFPYHPKFQTQFNPAGLVGILLTNGLFKDQTLWQDVQRLSAGHLLTWQPETSPQLIQQYQIPGSGPDHPYTQLSFAEQLDQLDHSLNQAIARHAPADKSYSLLLSGGLDSRMLAGYLDQQGRQPIALTLGIPSDIEMQCAIPVARTLGFNHRPLNISFKQYPTYAETLANWDHLASGYNWVMNWGLPSALAQFPPNLVTGYLVDRVIGGKWNYSLTPKTLSFDTFFAKINACALSQNVLKKLLRPDVFGDLVADTLEQIREVYISYSPIESARACCFEYYHRQRFHIGSMAWQACFGAWPILPVLDQQLLDMTAKFPVQSFAHRQAQNQLVCTHFPQLARLPLDRNDFNVEPLLSSPTRQRLARLFFLQLKWRRLLRKLGYDRRYYYRVYDINNPGWKAVRYLAEPQRQQIGELFDLDVLEQLLPPPHLPIKLGFDPIPESSGLKALLGFLLWSKDHL